MELYLEGKTPEKEQIKASLRNAVVAGKLVPALCGTAFKDKGVQLLLNAVVDYLPSPVDIWETKGTDPDTEAPISRHCGDDQPFSALVFKIMNDPYVGKLAFIRIYSGMAEKGATVINPRTRRRERLGRLLQMQPIPVKSAT